MAAAYESIAGTFQYYMMVTIGAVIDQTFVLPSLFPPDPIEGQRIGEIQVMGADEGSPVARAYGSQPKLAGQLIWCGDLEKFTQSERQGKSGRKITHHYFASVGVAICDVPDGKALQRIREVRIDGKPYFKHPDDREWLDVTLTGLACYHYSGYKPYIMMDTERNSNITTQLHDQINAGDILDMTQSAFPNTNFRRSFNISGRGTFTHGSSDPDKTYLIFGTENNIGPNCEYFYREDGSQWTASSQKSWGSNVAQRVIQTPWSVAKCWDDRISWSDVEPEIHLGNNTDTSDIMDQAAGFTDGSYSGGVGSGTGGGTGETNPRYKDTAYVVIEWLQLKLWGHRVPNFEFIVLPHADRLYTRDIIVDILEDAGLDPDADGNGISNDFDCTGVARSTVHPGYVVMGPAPPAKSLQPIMLAENIVAQERGGKFYFFDRANAPAVTIEDDFLGVSSDEKHSGKVSIQQVPSDQRLGEVTVSFTDSENDFAVGTERASAVTDATGANKPHASHRHQKQSVNFNRMTMTGDKAREIAHRILGQSWADNLEFKFTLPSRYFGVQESDRLTVPVNGVDYPVILRKVDTGPHGILQCEGTLDVAYAQDYSGWTD